MKLHTLIGAVIIAPVMILCLPMLLFMNGIDWWGEKFGKWAQ